jgi:hypothetical protein
MELSNEQIRPKSSSEFASLSIKGVADPGAILADKYGVAYHQHQVRVVNECVQHLLYLSWQPKIILVAEKYDLAGRAEKRRLEGTEDALVFSIPYQDKASILQCRYFAARAVCGTVVDNNGLITSGQLLQDGEQLQGNVAFALVGGNAY